jgi:hypothetical protein
VLATDIAAGAHRVDVRANIDDFGQAQATTTYRLDEAKP